MNGNRTHPKQRIISFNGKGKETMIYDFFFCPGAKGFADWLPTIFLACPGGRLVRAG
jgi:hypothetical protein